MRSAKRDFITLFGRTKIKQKISESTRGIYIISVTRKKEEMEVLDMMKKRERLSSSLVFISGVGMTGKFFMFLDHG